MNVLLPSYYHASVLVTKVLPCESTYYTNLSHECTTIYYQVTLYL